MTKILLNAVPIECAEHDILSVGIQPYDRDKLKELRTQHGALYLFRRGGTDGSSIHAVALEAGLPTIGETVEQWRCDEVPWLVGALAIQSLSAKFRSAGGEIISLRPLKLVSRRPADLFPQGAGLPPWLRRRIVFSFETRLFPHGVKRQPLLMCGVRTMNAIDANCAVLIANNIPLEGRYVTRAVSPGAAGKGRFQLAGRVRGSIGSRLLLEDCGPGPNEIEATDAFLENRRENMEWCVRNLLASHADRILEQAERQAAIHVNGPGRLKHAEDMFAFLRRADLELAPGVPLRLGPLIGGRESRVPVQSGVIQKPTLVFDPSGTRTDKWNERGLDQNGPYDQRTFSPKELKIAVICQESCEGEVDRFIAKFLDGLPNEGSGTRRPYEKGFIRRYALQQPTVQIFTARSAAADDYIAACRAAIAAASDQGAEWDLAIVQIDGDFRDLPMERNPYFAAKAAFLKHRVPVQEVTLNTIRMPDARLVFALNNMSVATYAKIGGIPWLLQAQPRVAHELVIGIGSQTLGSSRLGNQERRVGITTVFSSDGRYILENRTAAVAYSDYPDALITSLSRSIQQIREMDNWRNTDDVRLIFHMFKEARDVEAEAVARLIEELGLTQVRYAFLHIVDDHPFALFDEENQGVGPQQGRKGVLAPERGTAVRLGESEALICFSGSREVKQAHHGLPHPSLLKLHRKSTFRDMNYLTRQAFDFSCHSWRMFSPAPVPITIHYSELIARLLAGLDRTPNWDPDAMLGAVGRTRWFL